MIYQCRFCSLEVDWKTIQISISYRSVVSTPLKNICQNENLLQIGENIKNIWIHHPVNLIQTILIGLLTSLASLKLFIFHTDGRYDGRYSGTHHMGSWLLNLLQAVNGWHHPIVAITAFFGYFLKTTGGRMRLEMIFLEVLNVMCWPSYAKIQLLKYKGRDGHWAFLR